MDDHAVNIARDPRSHTQPVTPLELDVHAQIIAVVAEHVASVLPPESDPQLDTAAGGAAHDDALTPAVRFRHTGWARNRRKIAESLSRVGASRSRREAFNDCGSHAYVMETHDGGEDYRLAGSCCHDRYCVPCATARSTAIASNLYEHVKDVEIRFATLTIKTQNEPLSESLNKLYNSFQRLRRRSLWTERVRGGVAFTELKWIASTARWHPHLHLLLEGRWIDRAKLRDAWHECTGDSWIVDIQRPENKERVVREVCKYASKPFNNTFVGRPVQLDEAVTAMAGRKLMVTFGTWRSLLLSPITDERTWEHVCSLEILLLRVANKDRTACRILDFLTNDDVDYLLPKPRPPPADSPPNLTAQRQTKLFTTSETNDARAYGAPF